MSTQSVLQTASQVPGKVGSVAGGAAKGAATGASIGSIVPGVGTAIGGAVGGLVGGVSSLLGGGHPKDAERIQNANNSLQRALQGDQAAVQELIAGANGSATDVGKQAYRQALAQLQSGGGSTSVASILGNGGSAPSTSAPPASDGGFSLGNVLGSVGSFLTGNGGKNVLGIAQGVNGILDQKKSENYAKDALGAATGAYNAAAPLRAQGMQGILNPTTPDLSGLKGIASGVNPTQGIQGLDAISKQLASSNVQPTAPTSFAAPQRPTRVASIMKDAGNPYAA